VIRFQHIAIGLMIVGITAAAERPLVATNISVRMNTVQKGSLTFYAAESLRLDAYWQADLPVDLADTNQLVLWEVASATNQSVMFLSVTGIVQSASNRHVRFSAAPAASNLRPGGYEGKIRAIGLDGGTETSMVVLARQTVTVLESTDSGSYPIVAPLGPYWIPAPTNWPDGYVLAKSNGNWYATAPAPGGTGGVSEVVYGTTTGTAYRGDWGQAASNLAALASNRAAAAQSTATAASNLVVTRLPLTGGTLSGGLTGTTAHVRGLWFEDTGGDPGNYREMILDGWLWFNNVKVLQTPDIAGMVTGALPVVESTSNHVSIVGGKVRVVISTNASTGGATLGIGPTDAYAGLWGAALSNAVDLALLAGNGASGAVVVLGQSVTNLPREWGDWSGSGVGFKFNDDGISYTSNGVVNTLQLGAGNRWSGIGGIDATHLGGVAAGSYLTSVPTNVALLNAEAQFVAPSFSWRSERGSGTNEGVYIARGTSGDNKPRVNVYGQSLGGGLAFFNGSHDPQANRSITGWLYPRNDGAEFSIGAFSAISGAGAGTRVNMVNPFPAGGLHPTVAVGAPDIVQRWRAQSGGGWVSYYLSASYSTTFGVKRLMGFESVATNNIYGWVNGDVAMQTFDVFGSVTNVPLLRFDLVANKLVARSNAVLQIGGDTNSWLGVRYSGGVVTNWYIRANGVEKDLL